MPVGSSSAGAVPARPAADDERRAKTNDEPPVAVRPEVIRRIAQWWQGELDRYAGGDLPEPPPLADMVEPFGATREEALRGLTLGEHRHFSGTTD